MHFILVKALRLLCMSSIDWELLQSTTCAKQSVRLWCCDLLQSCDFVAEDGLSNCCLLKGLISERCNRNEEETSRADSSLPEREDDTQDEIISGKGLRFIHASIIVAAIERLIDYKFKQKSLAAAALMNQESQQGPFGIDRRMLAFLGDALIDLLVVEQICDKRPESNSGIAI